MPVCSKNFEDRDVETRGKKTGTVFFVPVPVQLLVVLGWIGFDLS